MEVVIKCENDSILVGLFAYISEGTKLADLCL